VNTFSSLINFIPQPKTKTKENLKALLVDFNYELLQK